MSAPLYRSRMAVLVGSFLIVTALAASCGNKADQEASDANPQTASEPTPAPSLTDANIAAIVVTANQVDIENAKAALGKTKNDAVKAFANQMVADHTSVNQQATDLAAKLSLTPEENDTSRQLQQNAEATRKMIGESNGAAFDKSYVANEVAYHQAVLEMLDQTLIPGATNAELKSLLQSVRPAFQAHLEHAQHVQSSLPS